MLRKIISIGDKIDIKPLDGFGKPMRNSKSYISQLLDYVDHEKFNIGMPFENGRMLLLEMGKGYNLCFYTSKGLYQCNCQVVNRFRENNIYFATVLITTDLEKVQRRQYYRLECLLDMQYHIISPEEGHLEKKIKNNEFISLAEKNEAIKRYEELGKLWYKASMIDISGGGARFNSDAQHERGDQINIRLDLGSSSMVKKLSIGAIVITSTGILNRPGKYEHRIEFTNIDKKEREEIIKYIFEQERLRRSLDK
ncbi:MAG: hypothetical protein K0S47_1965 [Herbinix sp.]|jgi:c-di-GMP-binding flagellar brake protein YcgR|nr:hypothetical protein [Herbinix sp.]